jgi:hypothetical protein
MIAIGDPGGGFGASLTGTVDEIVAQVRRVDPSRGVRNLGAEPEDGTPVTALAQGHDGRLTPADTRPPWQRG